MRIEHLNLHTVDRREICLCEILKGNYDIDNHLSHRKYSNLFTRSKLLTE